MFGRNELNVDFISSGKKERNRMFGLFKKDIMTFKSNRAAFETSCKYMVNNLAPNEHVLAVVLSELDANRSCIVKLANREHPEIPRFPVTDASSLGSDSTICKNAVALEAIRSLKPGDLVMYTPNAAIGMMGGPLNKGGFLSLKVKPIYSNRNHMWEIDVD